MADQGKHPGRLIAIDGSRGRDVGRAAAAVVEALRARRIDCAVSRFDASGLFGELAAAARVDRQISIRTLTLVYAADLAFRLRWEIRPVLEAGGVVIASPYVDTAVAFAAACGLDAGWTRQLLRFAPPPTLRARAEERKINKGWKPRLDRGYPEFSAAMLEAASPGLVSKAARRAAVELLNEPVRRSLGGGRGRRVFRLSEKGVGDLAKAVTDSRPAAARRSAAAARSARR